MKFFGDDATSQKVKRLKNTPVFRDLSRPEILEVDGLLHERTYERDEIIFEQGDAGHGVFIVVSGRVRMKSSCKLLETAVPEFGPGDMFGELSLFNEAPRSATVIAIEPTFADFRRRFVSGRVFLAAHQKQKYWCQSVDGNLQDDEHPGPAIVVAKARFAERMRSGSQPGAVTLLAVIVSTCAVLFLFQKIIWLVLPALLGLGAYYGVRPIVDALVVRSVSHSAAAKGVCFSFNSSRLQS